MSIRVFLLLVVTAVLWGSTSIIEKPALRTTDPLLAVTIRSIFITAILAAICTLYGKWTELFKTSASDTLSFCLSGLMAGLLGMFTYYLALRAVPASKAVPIAASYPLVAAVLGAIFLGESLTPVRIIGTLMIIIGVSLVK
ncbi:MAG: EamA family transporter [Elusimicrobiota bacterium]